MFPTQTRAVHGLDRTVAVGSYRLQDCRKRRCTESLCRLFYSQQGSSLWQDCASKCWVLSRNVLQPRVTEPGTDPHSQAVSRVVQDAMPFHEQALQAMARPAHFHISSSTTVSTGYVPRTTQPPHRVFNPLHSHCMSLFLQCIDRDKSGREPCTYPNPTTAKELVCRRTKVDEMKQGRI